MISAFHSPVSERLDVDEFVNPYSPQQDSTVTFDSSRGAWRLAPAFLVGLLGLASLALGCVGFALVLLAYIRNSTSSVFGDLLPTVVLYIGFGVCWATSGYLIWTGRTKIAIYAALLGVIVLISSYLM